MKTLLLHSKKFSIKITGLATRPFRIETEKIKEKSEKVRIV